MCKLRTNREAFCRRHFEAMATWSVGWLEKHLHLERVNRAYKQCLESHRNYGERKLPGERLGVLRIYSQGGGIFSNLSIKGNTFFISSPRK